MSDGKTPIEFIKRFKDKPFTRWKGGRYRFKIYDNETNLFQWIFENKVAKEIKWTKVEDDWQTEHYKLYDLYFKTGETFIAFKLTWL